MINRKKRFVKIVILTLITIFMIMPVLLMISLSLKEKSAVFEQPFRWISDSICIENYKAIIEVHKLHEYFFNSIIVATIATSINLFLSSMAGFSLSKYNYKGKKTIFTIIIFLLILPAQVLVIPLFIMITKMNLNDSLKAIILPYMTSPFAIFFMRQFFISIPDETIEAARIDGASEWQIYWRVALPQAKPVLGSLGIFSFMFNWNNFMWPLLALKSKSKFTLPLGIAMMSGEFSTPYNELMAAATVASFPVLIIFFILQNNFINGMVISENIKDRGECNNGS